MVVYSPRLDLAWWKRTMVALPSSEGERFAVTGRPSAAGKVIFVVSARQVAAEQRRRLRNVFIGDTEARILNLFQGGL